MFIKILAIGKINNSPYKEIFDLYQKRAKWKITIQELELKANSKKISQKNIMEKEGRLLLDNLPEDYILICLDPEGKILSSENFAQMIDNYRQNATKICFAIGGANGFSNEVKNKATKLLSFGKMTFPHMMARVILIEQIYRAFSILSNHPYHKKSS